MYGERELHLTGTFFCDLASNLVGANADDHLFHTLVKVVKNGETHKVFKVGVDVNYPFQGIATSFNDVTYDLRVTTATIEIHKDSIKPGQKVVLVDDLIATGGTIEAAAKLIEKCGGEVVKIIFLMELEGLEGRKKLAKYDVESVVKYPGK